MAVFPIDEMMATAVEVDQVPTRLDSLLRQHEQNATAGLNPMGQNWNQSQAPMSDLCRAMGSDYQTAATPQVPHPIDVALNRTMTMAAVTYQAAAWPDRNTELTVTDETPTRLDLLPEFPVTPEMIAAALAVDPTLDIVNNWADFPAIYRAMAAVAPTSYDECTVTALRSELDAVLKERNLLRHRLAERDASFHRALVRQGFSRLGGT